MFCLFYFVKMECYYGHSFQCDLLFTIDIFSWDSPVLSYRIALYKYTVMYFSFVVDEFGSFQLLVIIDKAAVDIILHVFSFTCAKFPQGTFLRMELQGSYDKYKFKFTFPSLSNIISSKWCILMLYLQTIHKHMKKHYNNVL